MKSFLSLAMLLTCFTSLWSASPYSGSLFTSKPLAKTATTQAAVKISIPMPTPKINYDWNTLTKTVDPILQKHAGITSKTSGVRMNGYTDIDGDGLDEVVVSTSSSLTFITIKNPYPALIETKRLIGSVWESQYPVEYHSTFNIGDFIGIADAISLLSGNDPRNRLIFEDINGDRKQDIILVTKYSLYVLIQGDKAFQKKATIKEFYDPKFIDLNADGIKDLVTLDPVMLEVKTVIFNSDFSTVEVSFPKKDILGSLLKEEFTYTTAKISKGSTLDFVLVTKPMIGYGKLTVYSYDAASKTFKETVTGQGFPTLVKCTDIDGDSVDEIYAGKDQMSLYKVTGNTLSNIAYPSQGISTTSEAVWEDFNKDGIKDFVLFNAGMFKDSAYLYLSKGNTFTNLNLPKLPNSIKAADPAVTNSYPTMISNFTTADINSDGFKDFICWNDAVFLILKNQAGTNLTEFFSGKKEMLTSQMMDLNGDGKLDCTKDLDYNQPVYLNDGEKMQKIDLKTLSGVRQLQMTDIDGDNIADLAVLGHNEDLKLYGVSIFKGKGNNVYEFLKGEFIPLENANATLSLNSAKKLYLHDYTAMISYELKK